MFPIILHSTELKVNKILKPTKAKFFQDLKEGDYIFIIHTLRSTTGGSNGLYASYFKVMNITQNTSTTISGNDLVARLKNFEISDE